MRYAFVYHLLFITCLITACKKKEPTANIKITDQRLRDAVTMKKGSFFIYQDSATNATDSVWIDYFSAGLGVIEENNATYESLGYGFGKGVLTSVTAGGLPEAMNKVWGHFFTLTNQTFPR